MVLAAKPAKPAKATERCIIMTRLVFLVLVIPQKTKPPYIGIYFFFETCTALIGYETWLIISY